jgi:hypothetical protein
MRDWFVAFATLLASSACGGDGPTPFALTVVADDGSVAGPPISLDAIDRVQVVITPQSIDGRFAPTEERVFEGGAATTRVTAAGEWVLTLERAWLDEYTSPISGRSFVVLLEREEAMDGATMDPSLRVLFYRGTEEVAKSTPRFVEWPLPEGGTTSVTVICDGDDASLCSGS